MTKYPYAGDGCPYTGPSYRAMVILGVLVALIAGILLGLADYASAQSYYRRYTPWQVWSQQCAVRVWRQIPDYCVSAYRAVTGR
jgi:hypothetical protein